MRRLAKSLAIRGGGLGLYHHLKHREVLTVLMFHRVLPQDRISAWQADEEYTISTALLERLMTFVAGHYNVVDLDDVLASRERRKPLPPYPLLITFDDGWEDNAVFASAVLAKTKMPWTLFAATDAISSGARWWQENLLRILRADPSAFERLKNDALTALNRGDTDLPPDRALTLLTLYGAMEPARRDALIAAFTTAATGADRPRDMTDWEGLAELQRQGVSIGGHGASHLPLTLIENPAGDLQRARAQMQQHLGDAACSTMSFPHGRYNREIVRQASDLGLTLMFTSDAVLNKCPGGWLQSDLVGRISISTDDVAREDGTVEPERVMPWLMLRPIT